MTGWKLALVLSVTSVVVVFIWVGRYSITSSSGGRIYIVDRFTGWVRVCSDDECKAVPDSPWTVLKQEKIPDK